VEQARKFKLMINLEAAKQMGLTILPKRADKGGQSDQVTEVRSQKSNFSKSLALCAMLFALCSSAEAQQPTKVPRIGVLAAPTPSFFSIRFGFRQRLREHGYL
jgi:ABC-type uncharacterized transport system substrate-binding protein